MIYDERCHWDANVSAATDMLCPFLKILRDHTYIIKMLKIYLWWLPTSNMAASGYFVFGAFAYFTFFHYLCTKQKGFFLARESARCTTLPLPNWWSYLFLNSRLTQTHTKISHVMLCCLSSDHLSYFVLINSPPVTETQYCAFRFPHMSKCCTEVKSVYPHQAAGGDDSQDSADRPLILRKKILVWAHFDRIVKHF